MIVVVVVFVVCNEDGLHDKNTRESTYINNACIGLLLNIYPCFGSIEPENSNGLILGMAHHERNVTIKSHSRVQLVLKNVKVVQAVGLRVLCIGSSKYGKQNLELAHTWCPSGSNQWRAQGYHKRSQIPQKRNPCPQIQVL